MKIWLMAHLLIFDLVFHRCFLWNQSARSLSHFHRSNLFRSNALHTNLQLQSAKHSQNIRIIWPPTCVWIVAFIRNANKFACKSFHKSQKPIKPKCTPHGCHFNMNVANIWAILRWIWISKLLLICLTNLLKTFIGRC